MSTVIYQEKVTAVPRAKSTGEDLWLTLPDLKAVGGWELKPEGVYRDQVCIPVSKERLFRFVREENGESWVNLAEFTLSEARVQQDNAVLRTNSANL